MDIAQLPKTLDLKQIEALRKAFGAFYDLGEESFTDRATGIHFNKVTDFVDFLYSPEIGIPKGTSAKHIGITLERWYETLQQGAETTTEIPKYEAESNTLTPDQLAQWMETERVMSEKIKQTQLGQSENVKAGIKRQQEIYREQIKKAQAAQKEFDKQQKYAKAEETKLSEDQQSQFDTLEQKAKANPQETADILSTEIKQRLGDTIPQEAADLTALNIVANLQTQHAPVIQKAVTESIKKDLPSWASPLSDQSKSLDELTKEIAKTAFGESFKKAVFPEVEVSDTPQPGFTPVSLNYLPRESIEVIKQQSSVLENPALTETDWAKSWTGSQLSRLKGDGSVVRETVTFTSFKPQGSVNWEATGGQIKLNIATGASEPLKLISSLAKGAAKKAAGKALTKAVIGFLAKLGAPETLGLSLVVGKILDWITDRINWKKVREYALAIISASIAIAGLIFSIPALTIGGGVGIGIGIGMGQGMTLASFGSGILSFFSAIGSATLGAIGVPILVTLLVFPVVVALILFIINSSAYVVPPTEKTSEYANFKLCKEPTCTSDKKYCFPVCPLKETNYPCAHHDYPAADIFRDGDKPGQGDDKPMTIVAYTAGTVAWVTTNNGLGGVSLMITGDDSRFYYYAHNERNLVQPGAHVIAGQPIALMDSTGNASSTQEHVHFGISKRPNFITKICQPGEVFGCVTEEEFQITISYFILPSSEFSSVLGVECPHN